MFSPNGRCPLTICVYPSTVTAGLREAAAGHASGHFGLKGQTGSPCPSPQSQLAGERSCIPSQLAVLLV